MTKSLFLSTTLVAVALVFAGSQAVEAQPTPPPPPACITAATNICNTICGKLPSWATSACKSYGCSTTTINAIATQVQAAAAQCAPTPPPEGAL